MIKDLGELEQLLKLLRSQGVTSFDHGNMSIELGDMPGEIIPEAQMLAEAEEPVFPSQAELDRAVNMPVGGLEDPFLTYNEQAAE